MPYNTNMDTITVNDVEYDVERRTNADGDTVLTIERDGEPAFEGIVGYIGYDQFAEHEDPREWSNVGTMAVSYRSYKLGDEDIEKIDFEVIRGEDEDGYDNWVTLNPVDYFKQERGARVVIGLTVYEHSGITMRAGNVTLPWDTDRWDTSFVGFIYDTPEKVKECMGDNVTDEQIEEALRSEVSVYASWLEGDVTCWSVEDSETDYHESCGGYIGDHKECESEAFSHLEDAIIARLDEIKERAEMAARDIITKE